MRKQREVAVQSQYPTAAFSSDRSLTSKFNHDRPGKEMQLRVEIAHLEAYMVKNPGLAQCSEASLKKTLLDCAAIGLTLQPSLAHAYPIPYYNQNTKQKECELSVGYRGMEHIVFKAGTVKSIQTEMVRRNDPEFNVWTDETGQHVKHTRMRGSDADRGDITHVYCIAVFMNGGHHIEIMDYADVLRCEEAATAKNSNGGKAWRGAFRNEMVKKCPVRRGYKHWPKDDAGLMERLASNMDRLEPMFDSSIDVNDSEQQITIAKEQGLELHAFLVENDLKPELADAWLQKLAATLGLGCIDDLPASKFNEVKSDLEEYLKQWQANQTKD